MPYEIRNNRGGCAYAVVAEDSGKVVGCHDSKQAAIRHLAALYINVPEARKHLPGKHDQQRHGGSSGTGSGFVTRSPEEQRARYGAVAFDGNPETFTKALAGMNKAQRDNLYDDMYSVPGAKASHDPAGTNTTTRADVRWRDGDTTVARGSRQFSPGGAVDHQIFTVQPDRQSESIGARINAKADDAYRAAGMRWVQLDADIDVGKYAWARQGFDFVNRDSDIARARNALQSVTLTQRDRRMSNVRAQQLIPDGAHAWDVAAMDDGSSYSFETRSKSGEGHLGKAVMLSGAKWQARKDLDTNTESYRVAQEYYRSRGIK